MAATLAKRSEVPVERTWDPTAIYPSNEAWEAAVADAIGRLPGLEKYSGHLGKSPSLLLEALTVRDALLVQVFHIYQYAAMYHFGDMNDQEANGQFGRAVRPVR